MKEGMPDWSLATLVTTGAIVVILVSLVVWLCIREFNSILTPLVILFTLMVTGIGILVSIQTDTQDTVDTRGNWKKIEQAYDVKVANTPDRQKLGVNKSSSVILTFTNQRGMYEGEVVVSNGSAQLFIATDAAPAVPGSLNLVPADEFLETLADSAN